MKNISIDNIENCGKTKSVTIYLRQHQIDALRTLKNKSGIPMATIIRRGVSVAIEIMEKKINGWGDKNEG